MVCSKCGKKTDRGKCCMYCGAMLHEKTIDYESTKTLMRSNIKLDDTVPVDSSFKEECVEYKTTRGEVDSYIQQPGLSDFVEEVQREVGAKIDDLLEQEVQQESIEPVSEEIGETEPIASCYEIDPMFGPPPSMSYSSMPPQKTQTKEKTGFFKRKK